MEIELNVSGMHCKSCGLLQLDVVSEVKGANDVRVDHKAGKVRFSYKDESAVASVKKAIEAQGYKVS